jgi:hypothetical protein
LVRGRTGVYAWDLPTAPDPRTLDIERYITLTIRAASNIFQPLGVSEADLRLLTAGQAKQLPLPYPRFNRSMQI